MYFDIITSISLFRPSPQMPSGFDSTCYAQKHEIRANFEDSKARPVCFQSFNTVFNGLRLPSELLA